MEDTGAEPNKKRGRPRIHPEKPETAGYGQGKSYRGQTREVISHVRDYFDREKANKGPLISVNKVIERTSAATKVSKNTVLSVCKEKNIVLGHGEGSTKLSTPGKNRRYEKRVTNLDPFQQDSIRRKIYDFYKRKECPTLNKIAVALKESELFNGSLSSLRNVLSNLGFKWKKICGRKLLMERSDIAAWRCRFFASDKARKFK